MNDHSLARIADILKLPATAVSHCHKGALVFDLSKIDINPVQPDAETDPVKIFSKLTLRGSVETLYGPQQEALTQWHKEHRSKLDVLISINTGGGKTLIGLLIAQSLVNESRMKVVYACPTNQLVQQTAKRAAESGISVATYMDGKWTEQAQFETATVPCITNYHALFNGHSIFRDQQIAGAVFDDAHVAPSVIRDCFTLRVGREHAAWGPLASLLRVYFDQTPYAPVFKRLTMSSDVFEPGCLFVPAWKVHELLPQIVDALEKNQIREDKSTRFAYEHLRDRLVQCGMFIDGRSINLTPTVLPTHTLPYFKHQVRRIYLTATLPSRYECIRTFGVDRAEVISPAGKTGTAQRLFVFVDSAGPYVETRALAADRKACVISSSKAAARKWLDFGTMYNSREGHTPIERFADSKGMDKLIFAGLFNGFDLPGRACNVLILDGIPRGRSLYDQFVEDVLGVQSFRTAHIASRLTQAIGRIFRSNTDHGVVILPDLNMQTWLRDPAHVAFFPPLLQQQVRLGDEVRKLIERNPVELSYKDFLKSVIEGQTQWDDFYRRNIDKIEPLKKPVEAAWSDVAASGEYEAFRAFWEERYPTACNCLEELANKIESHEPSLAAWYRHWAGLAALQAGEKPRAFALFNLAANAKTMLSRPPTTRLSIDASSVNKMVAGEQARRLASQLHEEVEEGVKQIIQALEGDGGTNAEDHEAALCQLGRLLGFVASRPDKQGGAGPDVLWHLPEARKLFAAEAKTQKESPDAYKKNKHIGKVLNDYEWLRNHHGDCAATIAIIGPIRSVAREASPPADLRIMPMQGFIGLAREVGLAEYARRGFIQEGVRGDVAMQAALASHGLLWPQCIDALEYRNAVDLQRESLDESE